VGIDIGTATSQIVLARLVLANAAGCFEIPRVAFKDKTVLHNGVVRLTPLSPSGLLDGDALRKIAEDEYRAAGVSANDVDVGAVIATGEAARKENAAIILESLAGMAGDFVVAMAGPDLEAVLAGRGSGAERASRLNGSAVVNLDVGGGTANIALFKDGAVLSKGSYDIGGRMVRVSGGVISHVSDGAARIAKTAGISAVPGMAADLRLLRDVCDHAARLLEEALEDKTPSPLLASLVSPGASVFRASLPIDGICFSGGVAECMRQGQGDYFRYGDVGPLLGEAISRTRLCSAFRRLAPAETVRATAVGAGCYSAEVSGSTIAQDDRALPLKNLPVLKLNRDEQTRCYEGDSAFLEEKIRGFMAQNGWIWPALAFRGEANPSYARLNALAACLSEALAKTLPPDAPFVLVLECDTAKALGQALRARRGGGAVVCVDSARVETGDYIDLGRPLMGGAALPIVVKTLVTGC
jgi:ethanolamine utilization protein EutA